MIWYDMIFIASFIGEIAAIDYYNAGCSYACEVHIVRCWWALCEIEVE